MTDADRMRVAASAPFDGNHVRRQGASWRVVILIAVIAFAIGRLAVLA